MKKNILGRKKEEGRLMIWIMFIDCVYMEEKRMNVYIPHLRVRRGSRGYLGPTGGHSAGTLQAGTLQAGPSAVGVRGLWLG